MTPQQKRLLASVGLLDLSLVLLWLGRFIAFDDTSGSGPDEWILPVGFLGLLAIGGSIVLSWPDRVARKAVGLTLMVIAGAAVVFAFSVDGFRFFYPPFAAEYVGAVVVFGLAGLVLAAPLRFAVYGLLAVIAAVLGLWVGNEGSETVCGSDADECGLADLGGLFVAGVAAVLVLLVAAVIESRRVALRREAERKAALRSARSQG